MTSVRALVAASGVDHRVLNVDTPIGSYDLRKFDLREKCKSALLRGAHLAPEVAFGSSHSLLSDHPFKAVLDSGATKHFVSEIVGKRLLNPRPVRASMCNANGKVTQLFQGGDLSIPLRSCDDPEATDCLHLRDISVVPGASFNLLSVSKLMDEGADFRLSHDAGNHMVYRGKAYPITSSGGLLLVDLFEPLTALSPESAVGLVATASVLASHSSNSDDAEDHVCAAAASAPMKVWHQRLGGVSFKRINHLNQSGSALGLKVVGKDPPHNARCTCNTCMMTNRVSRSVPVAREFADTVSRKGELITTDVVGPFPPSPEGYRYAISFTDEYTRFSVCYLLKKKSDSVAALGKLVRF